MVALSLLFPPTCACCGARAESTPRPNLCEACSLSVVEIDEHSCPHCALPGSDRGPCVGCRLDPPPFDRAHAAFEFGGALADVVRRAKYGRDLVAWRTVTEWASPALTTTIDRYLESDYVLTWVPMERGAARDRGFDPPAISLSWMGYRPVQLLRHHAIRQRQARLAAPSRLDHARASFSVRGPVPHRVCLFDDVMTTGATMRACAEDLRAAGTESVVCVAIARTPRIHG